MNTKIKLTILILLLMLSNISFISIEGQAQQTLGGGVYFNKYLSPVPFSIHTNASQSLITTFSIYQSNNTTLHISSSNFSLGNVADGGGTNIPVQHIVNNSAQIIDENYFISGNQQFVILSVYSINNNSLLVIKNLQTNQTFLTQGLSAYHISLVTSIGNSKNIYFSFYNETMFTIAKYSMANNSFSIAFHTVNLNSNSQYFFNIHSFVLNNNIYSSMVISYNPTSYYKFNSSIIILNSKGIEFNRVFSHFECDFIAPTSTGLLLHSERDGYFYNYQFSSNMNSTVQIQKTTFQIININLLKSFNNNSLVILAYNSLMFESFTIDQNTISVDALAEYNFNYDSNIKIYTLNLNATRYYVLGIYEKSIQQYAITVNTFGASPQDFNLPNLLIPSSVSFNQTTSDVYSYTSSPSVQTFNFMFFWIMILFIFTIVGGFIYYNKKERRNKKNWSTKSEIIKKGKSETNKPLQKSFCGNCGTLLESSDIFCQNCGTKL